MDVTKAKWETLRDDVAELLAKSTEKEKDGSYGANYWQGRATAFKSVLEIMASLDALESVCDSIVERGGEAVGTGSS